MFAALLLSAVLAQSNPPPPADALLKQVSATYAALGSYRDDGVVVTTFRGKVHFETRKPFSTIYSRARLFRFEFTEPERSRRYVVWQDGKVVYSWWSLSNRLECFSTISDALAGPTGVSGGSAHRIPTLLLGSAGGGWHLTSLSPAAIVGAEDIPGCPQCTVIEGKHPRLTARYRLWIDPRTLAVMRIEQNITDPDGTTVKTTATYHPQFNPAIDPAGARFKPPPSATAEGTCR